MWVAAVVGVVVLAGAVSGNVSGAETTGPAVLDDGTSLAGWRSPDDSLVVSDEVFETSGASLVLSKSGEYERRGTLPVFEDALFRVRAEGSGQVRIHPYIRDGNEAYYGLNDFRFNAGAGWTTGKSSVINAHTAPWTLDRNHRFDLPGVSLGFHLTLPADTVVYLDRIDLTRPKPDPEREALVKKCMEGWRKRLSVKPLPQFSNVAANALPRIRKEGEQFVVETDNYTVWMDAVSGGAVRLQHKDLDVSLTYSPLLEAVLWDGTILQSGSATGSDLKDEEGSLRFSYEPGKDLRLRVRYLFQPDSIEARVIVENHGESPVSWIHFPAEVTVNSPAIDSVIWPRLGGAELLPGFFREKRTSTAEYPSDLFSDWLAFNFAGGTLSMGTAQRGELFQAANNVLWGDGAGRPVFRHGAQVYVPQGSVIAVEPWNFWMTKSAREGLDEYARASGITTAPKLKDKVDAKTFEKLAQSQMVKLGLGQMEKKLKAGEKTFAAATDFARQYPKPAVIHPVTYWNPPGRGDAPDSIFDRNHPNFLPAADRMGGDEAYRKMIKDLRADGYLVAPYINPTAWGAEAVGFEKYGESIAIIGPEGRPHWGWHMLSADPWNPLVRAKCRELADAYSATHKVDFLFEDQVGARANYWNLRLDGGNPAAYMAGWVKHAEEISKTIPLATERGFDALIPDELAFCGVELGLACTQWMKGWTWDYAYGADNYRVYPVEVMLGREHCVFWHHDLGAAVFTDHDLSWSVAKGYSLQSTDMDSMTWPRICGNFQKYALSKYFGKPMDSWRYVADHVTESRFGDYVVTACHNVDGNTETEPGFALPANGFQIRNAGTGFRAGVFSRYYGKEYESPRYLVEERIGGNVVLRDLKPEGAEYTLPLSGAKPAGDGSVGRIVTEEDEYPITLKIAGGYVSFVYPPEHNGERVEAVVIPTR